MILLLVSTLVAAEPSSETQALLTGSFRLAEDTAVLQPRLDAATDKAIANLFAPLRPIAKIRLRPEVRPCALWHIALAASTFSQHCEPEDDYAVPLSGTTFYDSGDPYKVTVQVGARSVKITFMGEDGGKTTSWKVLEDGKVSVYTAILSKHLAEPLAWTAGYRRE